MILYLGELRTTGIVKGNAMKDFIEEAKKREKIKRFLSNLGETGKIADKVSDLILFHNRVRENAEKRYM